MLKQIELHIRCFKNHFLNLDRIMVEDLAEMLEYVDCFIEGDKIEDQQYQHCIKYGWMHNYLKQASKSE